jgi:hypothetical protein
MYHLVSMLEKLRYSTTNGSAVWKSAHLIIVSFFVYIFVNFFENLVHYNIGKFSNRETHFELPTKKDWLKIIIVMIVFALLQGILTYYFNNIIH